jgi:hypothetical protein
MRIVRKTYTVYMREDETDLEAAAFAAYFNSCDAALYKTATTEETFDCSEVGDEIVEFLYPGGYW